MVAFAFYLVICSSLLFITANSDNIEFENCGDTTVHWVDFSGCNQRGCVLRRGKEVEFNTSFLCNQDSEQAEISLKFIVNRLSLPVPFMTGTDGCSILTLAHGSGSGVCPLIAGRSYTFYDKQVLPRNVPRIEGILHAELYGDHGLLACVKCHMKIV